MSTKTFHLTVTWRGPFPMDMLRHDCAWPRSTEDGSRIAASFIPTDAPGSRPIRECELTALFPHADRWRSFGCGVRVTDEFGNPHPFTE